eukprot:5670984-Ditylum_brightwellii.AAC.1
MGKKLEEEVKLIEDYEDFPPNFPGFYHDEEKGMSLEGMLLGCPFKNQGLSRSDQMTMMTTMMTKIMRPSRCSIKRALFGIRQIGRSGGGSRHGENDSGNRKNRI